MPKKKSNILINIEYVTFYFFYTLIRITPLKIAYILSNFFCRIICFFDVKHRNRVIQHVMHAKVITNRKEAKKFAYKNFSHFSRVLVEVFKIEQLIKKGNISDYVELKATPKAYEAFFGENRTNAIIVTAHYGNWELSGMGYYFLTNFPVTAIMRPFNNPKIGKIFIKKREAAGHELFPKEGAIKALLKALKKGNSIGIIADQHAGTMEGVEVEFFGQPARAHISPALMHLKTQIPIMVGVTRRKPGYKFQYEYIVSDPIMYTPTADKEADIKNLTQIYTSELEKLIAEDPSQWLWAHRRWLNINRKKRNKTQ